jgi:hypothetical protein
VNSGSVHGGTDEEAELSGLIDRGADSQDPTRQTGWERARVTAADLLVHAVEHRQELTTVLQHVRSYVAIVSSRISLSTVEACLPEIRSALQRDVLITIFWCRVSGEPEAEHAAALNALRKLEYDSNHGQHEGRLVVNTLPLGADVNLLISDQPGGLSIVFGSYEWLGAPLSGSKSYSSVRVVQSSVGARLCDALADIASKEERVRTSSAVTSLRKFAGLLRSSVLEQVPDGEMFVEANVLFDETAIWYAHDLMESARMHVHIGAVRATNVGLSSFFERHPAVLDKVSVIIGADNLSDGEERGGALVSVFYAPDMKANIILVDGQIVALLNRPCFDDLTDHGRRYASAISLLLRGNAVAELLSSRLGFKSPHAEPQVTHGKRTPE